MSYQRRRASDLVDVDVPEQDGADGVTERNEATKRDAIGVDENDIIEEEEEDGGGNMLENDAMESSEFFLRDLLCAISTPGSGYKGRGFVLLKLPL